MNLRRACKHWRWEPHQEKQLLRGGHFNEIWCPGGTEPTTDELLAMLVEEGVLQRRSFKTCRRCKAGEESFHQDDFYESGFQYESPIFTREDHLAKEIK